MADKFKKTNYNDLFASMADDVFFDKGFFCVSKADFCNIKNSDALSLSNILCGETSLKKTVAAINDTVKKGGFLRLSEVVTDVEDAYLNALEFKRNRSHGRFYTVKEIVSAFENSFALVSFETSLYQVDVDELVNGSEISKDEFIAAVNKFPQDVKDKVFDEELGCVCFSVGTFIFKKI